MKTRYYPNANSSTAAFIIALFLGAFSCDPVDGTDPYAMWDSFEDSNKTYHFHYLAPPWELTGEHCLGCTVLVAHREGASLAENGLPGGGLQHRFGVEVDVVEGLDALEAADHDAAAWLYKGASVEPVETFESAAGDLGYLNRAETADREIEAIYYDFGLTRALVLTVVGQESLDFSDMNLLLESFEARPAED